MRRKVGAEKGTCGDLERQTREGQMVKKCDGGEHIPEYINGYEGLMSLKGLILLMLINFI